MGSWWPPLQSLDPRQGCGGGDRLPWWQGAREQKESPSPAEPTPFFQLSSVVGASAEWESSCRGFGDLPTWVAAGTTRGGSKHPVLGQKPAVTQGASPQHHPCSSLVGLTWKRRKRANEPKTAGQNSSFPHGETFLGPSCPHPSPLWGWERVRPFISGTSLGFLGTGRRPSCTDTAGSGRTTVLTGPSLDCGDLVLAAPAQGWGLGRALRDPGECSSARKPGAELGPRERESPPKPEAFPSSRLQRPARALTQPRPRVLCPAGSAFVPDRLQRPRPQGSPRDPPAPGGSSGGAGGGTERPCSRGVPVALGHLHPCLVAQLRARRALAPTAPRCGLTLIKSYN